jgi:hypothetical protein
MVLIEFLSSSLSQMELGFRIDSALTALVPLLDLAGVRPPVYLLASPLLFRAGRAGSLRDGSGSRATVTSDHSSTSGHSAGT